MEAYDRLPKAIRQALANADHNWSAGDMYTARRRKLKQVATIADAVAFISAADAKRNGETDDA
jgi:hypothetical protein